MNIGSRLLVVAALGLGVAAGCGNSVEGTGGSSSSTGATGGVGGSGNTGGLGGGACDGYDDQTSLGAVHITFQNDTFFTIYLQGMCSGPAYNIASAIANDPLYYTYEPSCLQTCQDLTTQPQFECGACLDSVYRLDPGTELEVTWDGLGLTPPVQMAAECWAQGNGGQCSELHAAVAGSLTVTATAYDTCVGDCTCDANDVCAGSAGGTSVSSLPSKFTFPTANQVIVNWGTCAFGCPPSP